VKKNKIPQKFHTWAKNLVKLNGSPSIWALSCQALKIPGQFVQQKP